MSFLESIALILSSIQVRVLVILVVANFVFAVLDALAAGTFQIEKLPKVIERLLVVVISYGLLALMAALVPDYAPIRDATWALLLAAWGKKTAENLLSLVRKMLGDAAAQS